MAVDKHGRDVFLADTSYGLALAQENFKDIRFHFTSEFLTQRRRAQHPSRPLFPAPSPTDAKRAAPRDSPFPSHSHPEAFAAPAGGGNLPESSFPSPCQTSIGTSIINTFASVSPFDRELVRPGDAHAVARSQLARRLDAAFDHEDVGAVAAGVHAVFDHTILVEVQRIEPSVLMHPSHMLAAAASGATITCGTLRLAGASST